MALKGNRARKKRGTIDILSASRELSSGICSAHWCTYVYEFIRRFREHLFSAPRRHDIERISVHGWAVSRSLLYAVFFMPELRARLFSSLFIPFLARVHIRPRECFTRRMTYISNAFPYANHAKGETTRRTADYRWGMRAATQQRETTRTFLRSFYEMKDGKDFSHKSDNI